MPINIILIDFDVIWWELHAYLCFFIYFDNIYNKIPEPYRLKFDNCSNGLSQQMQKLRLKPVPEMYIYSNTEEACDYIDRRARIYFPAAFIFMMSVYWTTYLYMYEDDTVYVNWF